MKQISGKAFAESLSGRGGLVRTKGSHHIYTMEGRIERISIPVHGNKPLKVGLLRALMKIAHVAENEL
ncbi:MAG: type II toxin-antitoxin system HicA family toxin [Opitutales bacterium]